MTNCNILYTVDDASLPAPLPTVQEIESVTETLNLTLVGGCKVVQVGDHFIVKYGKHVDLLEGETMLFLEQSTTVPVPRVYALFRDLDQQKSYIVMERIRGPTLQSAWSKMDDASKEIVSSKLRLILEDMRKLKTPGGYCSVGHRGLPDGLFWTNDPSNPFSGPFDTEADLNGAIVAKYIEEGHRKHKADYYARVFKDMFQGHSPVFTHGDLQRKNIMLRGSPKQGETEALWDITDLQIVVIDWEFSGWYPTYWEYAKTIFSCERWDDDWNFWVDRTLEPYRNEYAWMYQIMIEMWS